jgi:hypothetical protein
VNNDGTGSTIECPKFLSISHIFGLLPVVMMSLEQLNWAWLVSTFQVFSVLKIDWTLCPVKISILYFLASDKKQSMMVCDESDTGNIRPSSSILSSTPRFSNHSMVSPEQNW